MNISLRNLDILKQTGTLSRNNGIKAVSTKCTANSCKQTIVKCFVHAQKIRFLSCVKNFQRRKEFLARIAIVPADGTVFSQDIWILEKLPINETIHKTIKLRILAKRGSFCHCIRVTLRPEQNFLTAVKENKSTENIWLQREN